MSKSDLSRRAFLAASAALPIVGACTTTATTAAARKIKQPNIVVVVVDDMRFDEYGAGGHPYLETPFIDALGASGATFRNAYHTTPLCSPNRASILTGQYASMHGIIDNTSRAYASHQLHTFAQELQLAGYETAHVGKWHMGNDPTPRPGYDYWVSFAGQGSTKNPELFEDGRLHRVEGYVTDLLTERAIEFATRKRSKPFMVYIGHKAIHPQLHQLDDGTVDTASGKAFVPAERHRGRYAGEVFPRRPNYDHIDVIQRNQPIIAHALKLRALKEMEPFLFRDEIESPMISDETIQQRAEMMLAVDEGVGQLLVALEENGLVENTLFVLMSDNGYFFGEHGLGIERRLPYEEAIKGPLIMSHPASIERSSVIDQFALSIDVAPTLVSAAGRTPPGRMQGRTLLPLLHAAETIWRDAFLVEYYAHENPFPWAFNLDYRAIRMGQYKYVRWIHQQGFDELYDLASDPYEQKNLIEINRYSDILHSARARLADLVLASMGFPSPAHL